MEQSPRPSACQEIPRILWNPTVHYRIHKRPPPVPPLSSACAYKATIQFKRVTNEFHCFTVHFNSLNITDQQMHIYIYIIKH
jgi:hypothetical protein